MHKPEYHTYMISTDTKLVGIMALSEVEAAALTATFGLVASKPQDNPEGFRLVARCHQHIAEALLNEGT